MRDRYHCQTATREVFSRVFVFVRLKTLFRFIVFPLVLLAHGCVTGHWSTESPSILRFEGYIEKSTAEDFFKIVTPDTRQIIVTSGGGDAAIGMTIAEYIFSHKIDIVVDGHCASSCANYLFLAANKKTVRPGSWLGFHGGTVIPSADIDKKLSQFNLTDEQKVEATRQLFLLAKKQDDFFRLVPGGDIVARSYVIATDPRVAATVKASGYSKFAWLPSKEELEKAGVKHIDSFGFPNASERVELSKKHKGLLLSTEEVEALKK